MKVGPPLDRFRDSDGVTYWAIRRGALQRGSNGPSLRCPAKTCPAPDVVGTRSADLYYLADLIHWAEKFQCIFHVKRNTIYMVSARPSDLPDFDNPPVVETVLSAQFEPLTQIRTAHLGLFWNEIKDRFPKAEERPPLDPVFEVFPEPPRPALGLRVEAYESPPIPRFWFTNESGTELVQIQPDRFIRNWRKVGQGDQYPRYEKLKARFEEDFILFERFITTQGIGNIKVNQCEVTYINHIIVGEGWHTYEDVEKVFTVWRQPDAKYPGPAHTVMFHARFVMAQADGKPIGRLHADLKSAVRRQDGQPMFVLNLTARGMLGDGIDFFDTGREWVVRSFAGITTLDMHKIWKRKS